MSDLTTLLGRHIKLTPELRTAIGAVAYGRATADQIKMVTDGLLKSGQFKVAKAMHPGLSDAETIRMMQWDHGVGIDCAGYVQQAFMKVHGGGRGTFGFKTFGNEDLSSLKGNPNFTQVKPVDIKPGDLIILDPPHRGEVGHTVLVRDRHLASADELKKFQDPNSFAKSGDPVHVVQVDASWSAGEDGLLSGGVQSRIWLYNEKTGKWADVMPDGKGGFTVLTSDRNGPYNHPMNGIFRPKRSQ
ncbi:hypothetical protein L0222_24255 [bacterium]|nr:hypothetical protein [bacterium]